MNNKVKPALVLGIICLVVALLIALVNFVAAPIIERAKKEAISESLRVVMPDGLFDESLPLDGMPETVTGVYKDENGGGHVVTLVTTKGYTGKPIALTVGVDTEGKVTGVVITETNETKDTDKVADFAGAFAGQTASGVDGSALVSGATYSSRAVKDAVYDAMIALGYAEAKAEGDAPATDNGGVPTLSEEEAYAKALALSGATALKKITVEGLPSTAKAVYQNEADGSYVLHIATRTEWVPTETEGLIHVSKSGKILKVDAESFVWTVGHGVDYTPEYLESFIGKTSASVKHVDLVAEATRTADNFATAVADTMAVLFPVPVYRYVGLGVLGLAAVLTAVALILRKRRGF